MNVVSRMLLILLLAIGIMVTHVQAAEAAGKFEYKTIALKQAGVKGPAELEVLLNKLGAEGWELIEINMMGVAILKRQK